MVYEKYLDRPSKDPVELECEMCRGIFIGGKYHNKCNACAHMDPLTMLRFPPDCAPKGVPVLVAGGTAMKKTGGKWFSGMSDKPFTRELNWEPKWWSLIPQQYD